MQDNKQSSAWAGKFGDEYTQRNQLTDVGVQNRTSFWQEALRSIDGFPDLDETISSVLEIGAGAGANLTAMRVFMPKAWRAAVEVNATAIRSLQKNPDVSSIIPGDILDVDTLMWRKYSLVFTRGVLIHIAPGRLDQVLRTIYEASTRYILLAEYYAPAPTVVNYRGLEGMLWRDDFAGRLMELFSDVQLIDYGFRYRRDPRAPQDDITWFLMEK